MSEGWKPPIMEVWAMVGYDPPYIMTSSVWTRIKCPQHQDRTASAAVSEELNRWVCHACGISEDSWDLYMREKGVSLVQARQELTPAGMEVKATKRGRKTVERRSLWD